jgi:signal transduction histidine kinase
VFRSTSTRLAALYTSGFALSVVVLGASIFLSTRATLRREFDARLQTEAAALAQEFRTEGLTGVVQAVQEREETAGALDYGLQAPDGAPLAGRLARSHAPEGWSRLHASKSGERAEALRVLTTRLPEGYRLIVGDSDEQNDALEATLVRGFGWAFAGVLVLGALGGYSLGRDVHRRLAAMIAAAEGIIEGDLARRIPIGGSDDELDRLAAAFNLMLDRIAALMESLRQVSNDIAHDLRTPLTHLRQRLEASRSGLGAAERSEAIAGALEDVDAILDTFAALLRIAQIESGARRAAFRTVDLAAVASHVVEAFAPSAEDAGQQIRLEMAAPCLIEGDSELLTQMIANLVENALRHGGPRARVEASVERRAGEVELIVADDGPGIPETEREHVLERFYRLERSRSTPGSGLGLALVAAVARLHAARLKMEDAAPGLRVRVMFAPSSDRPRLGLPNIAVTSGSPADA